MTRLERVAYTIEKVKNTHVKVGMRSLGRENRGNVTGDGCTVLMETVGS